MRMLSCLLWNCLNKLRPRGYLTAEVTVVKLESIPKQFRTKEVPDSINHRHTMTFRAASFATTIPFMSGYSHLKVISNIHKTPN